MARIRYIKPDFFEDVELAKVSRTARLLYIGLWCFMDRQGIADGDLKLIKRNIFPYEDDLTHKKIAALIEELLQASKLRRVLHNGKEYLFCPAFSRHQKFHFREEVKFPISIEEILTPVQPPSSPVPASGQPPSSRVGMGMGMGMGMGTEGSSERSCETAPAAPAFASLSETFRERKVGRETQTRWLEAFPDPPWVQQEIRKALAWEASHPTRKKKNFAAFVTRWLTKGWDTRKTSPPPLSMIGKNTGVLDKEAEDLIQSYRRGAEEIHAGRDASDGS